MDHVDNIISSATKESHNRHFENGLREEIANEVKYSGYIRKQERILRNQAHLEHLSCPPDFDYLGIAAISHEAREKLDRMRPATLGQASRIDGVRAGDLAILTVHLRRWQAGQEAAGG